jgi:hypothetical protein
MRKVPHRGTSYKFFHNLKGTVYPKFFASGFFHESSSPNPLKITLGSFWIFSKILRDIRKSRCTTGINDTSGKFCRQYRRCSWYRWQIMRTISDCWHLKINLKEILYPYINSTTQRCQKNYSNFSAWRFVHLPLRISQRIFKIIQNGSRGLGKLIREKNLNQTWIKDLVTLYSTFK